MADTLSARGISQRFGERVVLDDVDLEVPSGRVDRAPRAERRRQDDAHADPVRRARTRRRHGRVARPSRRRRRPSLVGLHAPGARPVPGHAGARPARLAGPPPWPRPGHRAQPGRRTSSSASGSATAAGTRSRTSPAAWRSGCSWRRRWSTSRTCSCSTSRSPASTPSAVEFLSDGHPRPRPRGAEPALLEPPARSRRGPLRDDHAHQPRSGRAPRRRARAEGRQPQPVPARRRRGGRRLGRPAGRDGRSAPDASGTRLRLDAGADPGRVLDAVRAHVDGARLRRRGAEPVGAVPGRHRRGPAPRRRRSRSRR